MNDPAAVGIVAVDDAAAAVVACSCPFDDEAEAIDCC